jgi:hypothetical protein
MLFSLAATVTLPETDPDAPESTVRNALFETAVQLHPVALGGTVTLIVMFCARYEMAMLVGLTVNRHGDGVGVGPGAA